MSVVCLHVRLFRIEDIIIVFIMKSLIELQLFVFVSE